MSAHSASPEEGEFPSQSRALLTPGAMPPASHFGLTMMRHVVATGLRYALFQLGAPMPDGPPIRLVGLRLLLDRKPLADLLAGSEDERPLLAALLDPAATVEGDLPRRLAGAVAFHRFRIRLQRRARLRPRTLPPGATPALNGELVMRHLQERAPVLGDAVLGELISVLRRQSLADRVPSLGPAARAAWKSGNAAVADLGMLDPFQGPWSFPGAGCEVPAPDLAGQAPPVHRSSRRRGAFREIYRCVLTELAPVFDALGEGAVADGTLSRADDLFFVPFPLLDELTIGKRPRWLDGAVATNRAERDRLLQSGEHPDRMWKAPPLEVGAVGTVEAWSLGPLTPVP